MLLNISKAGAIWVAFQQKKPNLNEYECVRMRVAADNQRLFLEQFISFYKVHIREHMSRQAQLCKCCGVDMWCYERILWEIYALCIAEMTSVWVHCIMWMDTATAQCRGGRMTPKSQAIPQSDCAPRTARHKRSLLLPEKATSISFSVTPFVISLCR